jgi:hypothetical protein
VPLVAPGNAKSQTLTYVKGNFRWCQCSCVAPVAVGGTNVKDVGGRTGQEALLFALLLMNVLQLAGETAEVGRGGVGGELFAGGIGAAAGAGGRVWSPWSAWSV